MSEQSTQSQYEEQFIADLRNKLIGPKLHGASRNAEFTVSWYENNLGFAVKTHVPDDKNDGRIRFGGDNATSAAALQTLLLLIEGNPIANGGTDTTRDISWSFTRQTPGWGDNPQPKLINRLVVGRKDGRYFIAIDEEGRPQPVFYFGPSEHHAVLCNNKPASPSDISALYAVSCCENWINSIPLLQREYYEKVGTLIERWNEKKNKGKKQWNNNGNKKPWQGKKQWNNNGGGGGNKPWQNNNNGGGNKPWQNNQQNNQQDDFADDIPF